MRRGGVPRMLVGGTTCALGFYIAIGMPGFPMWRFEWLIVFYPWPALFISMIGGYVLIDSIAFRRTRTRSRASQVRDPWDPKDKPVDYGPYDPSTDRRSDD